MKCKKLATLLAAITASTSVMAQAHSLSRRDAARL